MVGGEENERSRWENVSSETKQLVQCQSEDESGEWRHTPQDKEGWSALPPLHMN